MHVREEEEEEKEQRWPLGTPCHCLATQPIGPPSIDQAIKATAATTLGILEDYAFSSWVPACFSSARNRYCGAREHETKARPVSSAPRTCHLLRGCREGNKDGAGGEIDIEQNLALGRILAGLESPA